MSFPIVIEDNVCSLKRGTQRINLEKKAGAGRLGQALPPGVEGGGTGEKSDGKTCKSGRNTELENSQVCGAR